MPDPSPARRRRRRPIAIGVGAVTIAYLLWLVIANRAELDRAIVRFQGAQTRWLLTAIALEIGSQACWVGVQHHLLRRAGSSLGLLGTTRLVLAQNAIGLAVPGGPALAAGFSYGHIRRRGSNASVATWVVAATNVVGLLALGTFGAVTSTGLSLLSMIVGAALVVSLVVLILLARSPHRLRRPATAVVRTWQRRRRHPSDESTQRVDRWLRAMTTIRLDWHDWLIVIVFALAAVAADCGVWLSASKAIIALPRYCGQIGLTPRRALRCTQFHSPSNVSLLVAYSIGQAGLAVPILPAGLGLVESLMTTTLTATKVRAISALSAVLLYRAISVGAVVLVGGVVWLTMRGRRSDDRSAPG